MEETCPFCGPRDDEVVLCNGTAYARYDRFPVTEGHMLIIPYRHVRGYFETTTEERRDLWDLVDGAKAFMDSDMGPDGYNIGINVGHAAGQTVMHMHIHLIPRRNGDVDDPRGGVRGAVPSKMRY